MGFVAAKVDPDKIEKAEKLLKRKVKEISKDQIKKLTFSVDKVMSEAGIYSEELTAAAIRQSLGDLLEASFILRAFKNTLRRIDYTEATSTKEMRTTRRISSAETSPKSCVSFLSISKILLLFNTISIFIPIIKLRYKHLIQLISF